MYNILSESSPIVEPTIKFKGKYYYIGDTCKITTEAFEDEVEYVGTIEDIYYDYNEISFKPIEEENTIDIYVGFITNIVKIN